MSYFLSVKAMDNFVESTPVSNINILQTLKYYHYSKPRIIHTAWKA